MRQFVPSAVILFASAGIAVVTIVICAFLWIIPELFPPLAPGNPDADFAAETERDGYTINVALQSVHTIFKLHRAEVE